MQPDVKCNIQETVPITVRTIHFYYSNTPVNTCSHKVSTRNYLQDYYSVLQLTFPPLKAGNRDTVALRLKLRSKSPTVSRNCLTNCLTGTVSKTGKQIHSSHWIAKNANHQQPPQPVLKCDKSSSQELWWGSHSIELLQWHHTLGQRQLHQSECY